MDSIEWMDGFQPMALLEMARANKPDPLEKRSPLSGVVVRELLTQFEDAYRMQVNNVQPNNKTFNVERFVADVFRELQQIGHQREALAIVDQIHANG